MRDIPSITVIVPSHNGGELTLACIESFLPQLRDGDRFIVVDNGSWDGTADHVRRLFGEDIQLVFSKRALGFAGACNRGSAEATTDLVLFANQDLVMSEGSLEALRKVASEKKPAVLGAKLYEPAGTVLQHLGGTISANALTEHRCRGMTDPLNAPSELIRCDYVTGSLLMLERALLSELGGFDARFRPAYFEETDLCVRAGAIGAGSYVVPWASARHFEAQVHRVESSSYALHYHRNRLRFVLKHFTNHALRYAFLPAERVLLRSRLPSHVRLSICRAYLSMVAELPLWLRERRRHAPSFVPKEVAA
jgi:GT2 family glycosyltransferase